MTHLRKVILAVGLVAFAACSSNSDDRHTTATTVVPPPPRQMLHVETRPSAKTPARLDDPAPAFDPMRPLLIFNLPNGQTFREGEEVVIDFSLANARLKDEGGEYRVRYIVDDEEMQWIDRWEQVVLSGWLPGKHTIRLELIGPDGWPYRNGDQNVVTRDLTVTK